MEKLRIVFMGTPEFAVAILDSIITNGYDVVGVITAPDKPAGRGQKVSYSAVKEYALKQQLTLLQPTNLKDDEFLANLRLLEANVQVVVAFRMLPEVVWRMPKFGTFNLHASLLPDYRGAAPINWAIINGEPKTGVTTFFIDDKIDTGAMIAKAETPIEATENAGQLHDRLMAMGSQVVVTTLAQIESGTVTTQKQTNPSVIKTAYKLNRENCKINFNEPVQKIYNLVRGLSPYPCAWCFINDMNVKLYEVSPMEEQHSHKIGTLEIGKKEMRIAASNGWILVHQLQLPGKKKMSVSELLNGFSFPEDSIAS